MLLLVADGDELAFKELITRYSEKVFFYSLNFVKAWHLAEETTQDIFLRIWQKRDKLREVEDWNKYLFVVTKNLVLNNLEKNEFRYRIAEANDSLTILHTPSHEYENKELRNLLEKAIEQLPAQKQMVFRMIHQQGLSQEQVGRQLGIAERTVRWNLVSAINGIKDFLHRHNFFFKIVAAFVFTPCPC